MLQNRKSCSEAEAFPIVRAHQDDVCGLDEQGSEILAPALGDAGEDRSATCAVLAWHETKPCAEIAPALECLAGADGGDHSGRDQRANAGNAHEALAVGFLLREFKVANKLGTDDKWDFRTEELLANGSAIRAEKTFVGSWSEVNCEPGSKPDIVISSRRAVSSAGGLANS